MMSPRQRVLWPIAVIVVAVSLAAVMVAARAPVEPVAPELLAPLVRVVEARPVPLRLRVRSQGTVEPRTASVLVPEVGGRVVWVSPALAAGGFFEAGEPLLRLDRTDPEIRLARAEAAVAAARSQAALARRNRERSHQLAAEGIVSRTALDDADNAAQVAAASLREAEAALLQARRDLARTELTAPYAGRVREKLVDVGQFVERGTPLARLYAVDYAEVRLPIPDRELAFLELPLDYRGGASPSTGPPVTLRAEFAGTEHVWTGRVVRTEGEIDARTRMITVVARVEDPYGRGAAGRPPLHVGLFVHAEILGRELPAAVVLPRAALRGDGRVLVVDGEERLRERRIDVVRTDGEQVIVGGGLAPGDRVCVSPLETATDGTPVRTVTERS